MSSSTIKVKLPFERCSAGILYTVAKPNVADFNTSLYTKPSNYLTEQGYAIRQIFKLNGSLYNLYGVGTPSYFLRKYDHATTTWGAPITIPNLPVYNCMIAASETGTNDAIYFYGGQLSANSSYVNSLYKYDVTTNTTTLIGSGGTARVFGCAAVSSDGTKFFAFSGRAGGANIAAFTECTIGTNTWVNRATTPDPRQGGSLISVGTNLYLYGATNIISTSNGKKLYLYNTITNVWEFVADAPTNASLSATLFKNDTTLYLSSFIETESLYKVMHSIDTVAKTFTEIIGTDPNLFDTTIMNSSIDSICYFNNQFWFTGYTSTVTNNDIGGSLYGTLDLTNHTNNIVYSDLGFLEMHLTSSIIEIIPIGDTPDKIRYQFYDSAMTDLGIHEYPITQGQTVNATSYTYVVQAPIVIKSDIIASLKISFKSLTSDWSPWSNLYTTGGA